MSEPGVFTLSLDVELAWGMFDVDGLDRHTDSYRATGDVVDRLCTLFDRYDVPATWALVAHLLRDCRGGPCCPDRPAPAYDWINDWFGSLPCQTGLDPALWYAPGLLDRLTDAVNAYKNVLKINSEDAEVLSALGFIYEIQEQNADIALMFCQRASQIDPDNGLFRHRLARIYYNRRHLPEALDEFQKAHDLGYDSSHYIQQTTKYLQDDQ